LSHETFLLPDVGEGLTEAEIVTWKVTVGDSVVLNQPLVDIETAKAVVELPSPYAATLLKYTSHSLPLTSVAMLQPCR
jgi:2-oxoisovalerate dehydrogenase E2 component (dihydrolipoyl transacylase)